MAVRCFCAEEAFSVPYGENMWGKIHADMLAVISTLMSQQYTFKKASLKLKHT